MQPTSINAYYSIIQSLGPRQIEVLKELEKLGSATNNELAHSLGRQINTITPRVNELKKKWVVEEKGKRPCKMTGMTAIVWGIKRYA